MPSFLYSVLRSNFLYPIPIWNRESTSAENFKKLMEMDIYLQDIKNLRKNITPVMREKLDSYLEELVIILNRGFKATVKNNSHLRYQVRN